MGENIACTEDQSELPFFVRQPIFDRDKNIWGYELIYSKPNDVEDVSLADMIIAYHEHLATLGVNLSSGKNFLLDLSHESHLSSKDLSEGWHNCVFGICQKVANSSQCVQFADSMRKQGKTIVLDSNIDSVLFNDLVSCCDIIKVSLADKTPTEIVELRRSYKAFGGELLAVNIASWEDFEGSRALGFKYFQGSFFSVPHIKEGAVLPASSIAKLQLLRELGNPSCQMEELAEIIAADISLSYRILKYINSVAFGLRNKIKSIQQAVSLLGLKEVRHWASVVVMTDIDSTPKGEELAYMALQRGRFLGKLSESIKDFPHSSNTMFMLGLFSKLDALLSYPMDKALEGIPLDDDVKDGLCGTLNEFREWILALNAIEIGNFKIANEILARHGACFTRAATEYMRAATWAAQQLPDMKN